MVAVRKGGPNPLPPGQNPLGQNPPQATNEDTVQNDVSSKSLVVYAYV